MMLSKLIDSWMSKKVENHLGKLGRQEHESIRSSNLIMGTSGSIGIGTSSPSNSLYISKNRPPDTSINFSIHPAHNGGFIVEYNAWDSTNSCYEKRLHIVSEDHDLGSSINHIITVELLRR